MDDCPGGDQQSQRPVCRPGGPLNWLRDANPSRETIYYREPHHSYLMSTLAIGSALPRSSDLSYA